MKHHLRAEYQDSLEKDVVTMLDYNMTDSIKVHLVSSSAVNAMFMAERNADLFVICVSVLAI